MQDSLGPAAERECHPGDIVGEMRAPQHVADTLGKVDEKRRNSVLFRRCC